MNTLRNPLFWSLLLLLSCARPEPASKLHWLGKPLNEESLNSKLNKYHMYDSNGLKVGSMIFGLREEGGRWVAEDTSQLDDGSIYETAKMVMDLTQPAMQSVDMDIAVQGANVFIDLQPSTEKMNGTYKVQRDTAMLVDRVIDSAYVYDAFREEVYMLLHAVDWEEGDSVAFRMFFPNSFGVVDAALVYESQETIKVAAGNFDTHVIYLNTGGLLDNRIWVSKEEQPKLVKFYVPNAQLSIELNSSVPLE